MLQIRHRRTLGALALLGALGSLSARADDIKTVFVIAMENHNWTQPANQFTGGIQQVYQNPNAPFINSLVNGTAFAVINESLVNISKQTAYAAAYHNVLATPSGNNPHIHPSEPNYLWAEAGTNFGVLNDNDPFKAVGGTNQNTPLHLSTLLTLAGKTWKSYQEDTDLVPDGKYGVVHAIYLAAIGIATIGWLGSSPGARCSSSSRAQAARATINTPSTKHMASRRASFRISQPRWLSPKVPRLIH